MAISFVASGTGSSGTTSVTPTYPAGLAANDLLVLCVVNKYPAAPPTTPSGWSPLKTLSGGSGASGVDSGEVRSTIYTKVATGSESGSETVTITGGNVAHSRMLAYRRTTGAWYLAGLGGTDSTVGTAWSVTSTTSTKLSTGSWVVAASGVNTDNGAWGSQAVTLTGATFSAAVERYDASSAQGDDLSIVISDHTVTSGSGAGALLYTATCTSAVANGPAGATALLVMSETPIDVPAGVADALVEIDVTNDPRSGVTTWTDVTAYVDGAINIVRGRQDELADQLSPATATLTLRNNDGRFTPDRTEAGFGDTYEDVYGEVFDSPYGIGFRKGIQIRISVDLDGTTYRRFRGYVDTIDGPSWPGGATETSIVQLTCSDELAQWSKGRKFADVLTETILADVPDAYYPLTDGAKVDESGNDQKRLLTDSRRGGGVVTFNPKNNDFEVTNPAALAAFIANQQVNKDIDEESPAARNWRGGSFRFRAGTQGGHNYLNQSLTIATSSKWAIECWARLNRESDGNGGWLVYLKNGSRFFGIGYNEVGQAKVASYDATTNTNALANRITNNDWHHVLAHYERGGVVSLYVDGRLKETGTARNWDNSTADPTLWIGSGLNAGATDHYGIQRGNLAHVAVYTGTNADSAVTNVADHYEAGWSGFNDARSGEMMERIVNWMQYPGGSAIDRGSSIVGDEFAKGATALEYAQLLIDSEQGTLYTTGDGTITFHERSYRYDNTTAALTVDSYHDLSTSFRTDDQYLVNKSKYLMPDGRRGTASNATSVSDYGPYDRETETLIRNENQADLMAKFDMFRWKDPDARLVSFPLNILTAPTSLAVDALATEIDDRISMTNLPRQAFGSSVTGYVEGWSEVIGTPDEGVWEITFNTSPTYTLSDSFTLNSAGLGLLNTGKVYY